MARVTKRLALRRPGLARRLRRAHARDRGPAGAPGIPLRKLSREVMAGQPGGREHPLSGLLHASLGPEELAEAEPLIAESLDQDVHVLERA